MFSMGLNKPSHESWSPSPEDKYTAMGNWREPRLPLVKQFRSLYIIYTHMEVYKAYVA